MTSRLILRMFFKDRPENLTHLKRNLSANVNIFISLKTKSFFLVQEDQSRSQHLERREEARGVRQVRILRPLHR